MDTVILDRFDETVYIPTPAAGIFGRIKAAFAAWCNKRQAGKAADREKEIKDRFDVIERDGRLFIACDGVAFQEITPETSTGEVVAWIQQARQAAVKFHSLKH